jgi:hypothetical protein
MRKWFIVIMLLACTGIAFVGCSSNTEQSEEEKINNMKGTIDITGITITSPTPSAQEPTFTGNDMLTYSISALDITFDYPSKLTVKSEDTNSVDLVSVDGQEELYVGYRDLPDGITLGEVIDSYTQTVNYSESYSSYGDNWYMISGEVLEGETDTSSMVYITGLYDGTDSVEVMYVAPMKDIDGLTDYYGELLDTIAASCSWTFSEEVWNSDLNSNMGDQNNEIYEVNQSQTEDGVTLDLQSYYYEGVAGSDKEQLCVNVKLSNDTGKIYSIVSTDFAIKTENGELINADHLSGTSSFMTELADGGYKEFTVVFDKPGDINKVSLFYQWSFSIGSEGMEFSFQ